MSGYLKQQWFIKVTATGSMLLEFSMTVEGQSNRDDVRKRGLWDNTLFQNLSAYTQNLSFSCKLYLIYICFRILLCSIQISQWRVHGEMIKLRFSTPMGWSLARNCLKLKADIAQMLFLLKRVLYNPHVSLKKISTKCLTAFANVTIMLESSL